MYLRAVGFGGCAGKGWNMEDGTKPVPPRCERWYDEDVDAAALGFVTESRMW